MVLFLWCVARPWRVRPHHILVHCWSHCRFIGQAGWACASQRSRGEGRRCTLFLRGFPLGQCASQVQGNQNEFQHMTQRWMCHCRHIGIKKFQQQWASLCIPWEDVLVVFLLLTSVSRQHMIALCKLLSLHFSIRLQAFLQRQTWEREIGKGPCYLPVKHQQTVVVWWLPSWFLGQQQDLGRFGQWPLQIEWELRISRVCWEGGHDWPCHRLWQGHECNVWGEVVVLPHGE